MTVSIEVCIDNIESLATAINAGANRIELCSALALGGLTPSAGLIKQAVQQSTIPIYGMVRPRAGDFIFDQNEINIMVDDISLMRELGVNGIVIGALTSEGDIDRIALAQLLKAAEGLGVTFHRAFDLCRHPEKTLEELVDLGCERVLTSGLEATAELGIDTIRKLVKQANHRISIMAGAGINANNAAKIVNETQVVELHLSGKTIRLSKMKAGSNAKMGNNQTDDTAIGVTGFDNVHSVVSLFE